MRMPIISGFRELEPAPRRFLFFVAVNVVSWQNIVGPAMVLFARKIDMPEFLVGLLISFLPFTQVLLLATMPLVTRFGPKRVMLWAWLLRNMIACIVFTMPFALAADDRRIAWAVLLVAILGFCIMRALGSGGWLPWLHEIVPEDRRSTYLSTETAVIQIINILIMLVQAWLLAGSDPSVTRFLVIYAIGIGMGFFSLVTMSRIHGGEPFKNPRPFRDEVAAYGVALRDRGFFMFMLLATLCISSLSWFGSATVMYMRDILKLHDSTTMSINAFASVGVLLTVGAWGRFAEHSGSGRTMFKSLTGHILAVLIFCVLPLDAEWRGLGAGAAITLASIFCAAFFVAANRTMLNLVPETHRIGYTAAWTVCTAMAFGLIPLLVGALIENLGLAGFRVCFALSAASGLVCALLCLRVVRDGGNVPSMAAMLNPSAPIRTIGRILWITLGLHESNRSDPRL